MNKPMIIEEANFVQHFSIGDAWRDIMYLCVKNGYDYKIEQGSYEGQLRKQLAFATLRILEPGTRPLAPLMPPGMPPPTDDEAIEKYFMKYIIEDKLEKNEQYTYGSYIKPQIKRIIEILNISNGNSNQAAISVGDREACNLEDPPCLRNINFKVVDGKLCMSVFFRSWDLYAGMPENLGGLQMFKEYILAHLNFPCEDGPITAYSDGLHIYEQYIDVINCLSAEKMSFKK